MKHIPLIIILVLSQLDCNELADTTRFDVCMLGMKVAGVAISHCDTTWLGNPATRLSFSTQTTRFASKLFDVDNRYFLILEPGTHQIIFFKKNTTQPGVINTISTEIHKGIVKYQDSDIELPAAAHNIFSLLYLLQIQNDFSGSDLLIEREGLLYNGQVTVVEKDSSEIKYQLDLDPFDGNEGQPVIEHTDIFTWAVFREKAKRFIWVDPTQSRITKCEFKVGLITLTAELENPND